MVALVVSSLLIGMILSIFTRMSLAYRAQQNVAELQQTLAAAQEMVQRDVRQAGYQMPYGFMWAGDTAFQQSLQVINNADNFGPDRLHVFHADGAAQARIVRAVTNLDPTVDFTSVTVDDADLFQRGDIAVIVTAAADLANRTVPNSRAPWLHYQACVVRILNVAGGLFTLDTAAPWGTASNSQCDAVRAMVSLRPERTAMIYRFSARAYRIDPARRALAVLQMSPTGGLIANDWQDLGVGFTDLQVATRWSDYWDPALKLADTPDLDVDLLSEWHSGEGQEPLSAKIPDPDLATALPPATVYERSVPSEIRISLVVRTIKKMDAVPTSATPALIDPARVDNNSIGDRPAVPLAGVADASRPAELRGDAIFRHATIGADLRNMAVGQ